MSEDDRIPRILRLLNEHVRNPSIRHIRDPFALRQLASEVARVFDRGNPVWRKWNEPRESFLKTVVGCWVPTDDLRDFLNQMEGPQLTRTDVAQRLRAYYEDPYMSYPNDDLEGSCLELYEREKALGTELPAIVGAMQEFIELEEERIRSERLAAWKRSVEEAKAQLEQRYLSGADCK